MAEPLAGLNWDETTPTWVISGGMGADSSAYLLRNLLEPKVRTFDLSEIAVVIAQTGNELPQTAQDNETAILPLLRAEGVRTIQVARSQLLTSARGDGVVVLSDTREPDRIHLDGDYTLETENLEAATVPQVRKHDRKCTIKAKGNCLDPTIAAITRGQPYKHVIGYEYNELDRILNDANYPKPGREAIFPLRDWGWTREDCEQYLLEHTGIRWVKSACYFCPFSLSNTKSRAITLARYAAHPEQGIGALFMEHVALALNSKQALIGRKRLIDVVRAAGHQHLIDGLLQRVNATEHALYDVRRLWWPLKDNPGEAAVTPARSVRKLATGTRDQMLEMMLRGANPRMVDHDDLHTRLHVIPRHGKTPGPEQLFAVAPAVVLDKQSSHFEQWWTDATAAAA